MGSVCFIVFLKSEMNGEKSTPLLCVWITVRHASLHCDMAVSKRSACPCVDNMREMWLRYQRCNPGCQENRKNVITLTFPLTLFRQKS